MNFTQNLNSIQVNYNEDEDEVDDKENDEEEDIYDVDKIIDKKYVGKNLFYKVRWEGFTSLHDTWEPISNLTNVIDLIDSFEESRIIEKEIAEADLKIDKVKKVLGCKVIDEEKLFFLVEWEPRSNGKIPSQCLIPHDDIKRRFPNALIDFYESRMKIIRRSD